MTFEATVPSCRICGSRNVYRKTRRLCKKHYQQMWNFEGVAWREHAEEAAREAISPAKLKRLRDRAFAQGVRSGRKRMRYERAIRWGIRVQNGQSMGQIAKTGGLSRERVRQELVAHGLPTRKLQA